MRVRAHQRKVVLRIHHARGHGGQHAVDEHFTHPAAQSRVAHGAGGLQRHAAEGVDAVFHEQAHGYGWQFFGGRGAGGLLPGAEETVEAADGAFAPDVGDVEDMVKHAAYILDDENLPTFKANALARAKDFDVTKILPHYESYYERVVESSKAVAI